MKVLKEFFDDQEQNSNSDTLSKMSKKVGFKEKKGII